VAAVHTFVYEHLRNHVVTPLERARRPSTSERQTAGEDERRVELGALQEPAVAA
jgi:hypothetical protein